FGDAKADTAEDVRKACDVIKAKERADHGKQPPSRMAPALKVHPATAQAEKIGKIAHKIRFDWDNAAEVFAQVRSEVDELGAELADPTASKTRIADELGDLYFSLAQLSRHLELEPELIADGGNRKFLRRF